MAGAQTTSGSGGLGRWLETEGPAEVQTLKMVKSKCYHLCCAELSVRIFPESLLKDSGGGLGLGSDCVPDAPLCQDSERIRFWSLPLQGERQASMETSVPRTLHRGESGVGREGVKGGVGGRTQTCTGPSAPPV